MMRTCQYSITYEYIDCALRFFTMIFRKIYFAFTIIHEMSYHLHIGIDEASESIWKVIYE